jgi:mannosyltransferase
VIKQIKKNRVIMAILSLAFAMRLIVINQSLWLDEAISAEVVRDFSYKGIITDFVGSDNHPPLFYLDLKFWTDLFGYSEFALRFPSVIYGVLTVFVTFLIAQRIVGKRNKSFPILASALLATSQFHIYYSQEARMYSLAAFLATLAIYAFLYLLKENDNYYWTLFSFAICALVFTDYVPVFMLPVFWIYAFLKKKPKSWWKKFLVFHLPLIVLGLLWLPTFLVQVEKGRWLVATLPAWKQVAGGASFKQAALVWMKFVLGRIGFRDKIFYYSLILIASVPFIVTLIKSFVSKQKLSLIWLWLVAPLLLGFISSYWAPFFIYFRFLFVVPAFYLLIAWGVIIFKNSRFRTLIIISILVINLTSWVIYVFDERQQREHWRQATSFVEEKATKDEVVIFEYPQAFTPYRWYSKGSVQAVGVTDSISSDPAKTAEKTKKIIQDKNGVYYFEYLRDLSDPERVIEQSLKKQGFRITDVYDLFPGVGQVFHWEKN